MAGLEPADTIFVAARGRKVSGPTMFGESERICPLFQRLPENGVCEFESSQPSQTVRYARRYFRACERHCGGVEAGLLMSQHRRHSTALSPANVISSIEGDDHQARGRSRKEANCDRIRCVLGSGPSIFSNSSDARLRPPDENLAQPNLVLIWFCRCWAAPFPTGNRTAQHLALGKTSPPVLPRRYDDKLLRARRFDPATCAVVP
jgi:hypothetical protein